MSKPLFYSFWLFIALSLHTAQAGLEARLDRLEIQDNETATITLTTNQQTQGVTPDLAPLAQDFDVLHSGQSSQVQIINGRQTASTTWSIIVAPKRTGKLSIPPLQVGADSSPRLSLMVRSAKKVDKDGQVVLGDEFLEVSVEPETAYVQSQLTYVLKLHHTGNLRSGSISPPSPANAQVQKLGEDVSYTTRRENRQYQVIEQRYAIFPEQSGTLAIPPITFQGAVFDPKQRRSRLSSPFDNMFNDNRNKSLRLRSEPLSVEIQARPADFPGNDWLPASGVVLHEKWSENPVKFQVGEPVTRTLILQARGLLAEQLPDIEQSLPPSLKAYPDQAKLESGLEGKTLIGQRQQNIALIPTQAGSLTLPAVEIPWWDVQQQKTRYARLPERVVEVLPAAASAQTPNTTTAPVTPVTEWPPMPAQALNPQLEPQIITVESAGWWPWLSAALGLGWLATLLLWWFKPRAAAPAAQHPAPVVDASPQRRAALKALEQACQAQHAENARQALLQWARARWTHTAFNNLGSVATRLSSDAAKQALADLDRYLYTSTDAQSWDGQAFWAQLKPALKAAHTTSTTHTALTSLYPVAPSY